MSPTLLVWRTRAGIAMDKQVAQKLAPQLTPERLERQWRAVAERTEKGTWWRFNFARLRPIHAGFALAAVLLLALGSSLMRAPRGPAAVAGSSFDNGSPAPATLKLVDGSQLQVSPAGRVDFQALSTQAVQLVLAHGWVELDVTHVPDRKFVVRAGDVDVIVRGTHFRVELGDADPKVVSVSVQRGQVEVRQRRTPNDVAVVLLGAGMSWTMGQRQTATEPAPVAASEPTAATPLATEPKPSLEPSAVRTPDSIGPKQLLEQADAARLSGHPREAANALDELRRRYRSDARAGLAALQLGRLRLDSLHDAAGALEAFRDAAALSASPSVQEDALARQAQALEALGNNAGCRRVRDQYLARYPSGIHSASIARRCGGN
jgi:transmembrane sensor